MEISLGAFIRFANATPKVRPRLAKQIAEQVLRDYDPATDFWRPMRQAITRDRKTTRDGSALRQLVSAAPSRRRPSFEAVSNQWGGVISRWNMALHKASTASRVDLGGVQVRVNPLFSEEWTNGHAEAACVWFNKEELQPETIHAVQHLLTRDEHTSHVDPVFIDVRRALTVPASMNPGDMDDWLDDLGHEFRRLAE